MAQNVSSKPFAAAGILPVRLSPSRTVNKIEITIVQENIDDFSARAQVSLRLEAKKGIFLTTSTNSESAPEMIHAVVPSSESDLKESLMCVLKEVEKIRVVSVAIPMFSAKFVSKKKTANIFIQTTLEYAKSKPTTTLHQIFFVNPDSLTTSLLTTELRNTTQTPLSCVVDGILPWEHRSSEGEKWNLLGGKRELLETPSQTALREFQEETNQTFNTLPIKDLVESPHCPSISLSIGRYVLFIVYLMGHSCLNASKAMSDFNQQTIRPPETKPKRLEWRRISGPGTGRGEQFAKFLGLVLRNSGVSGAIRQIVNRSNLGVLGGNGEKGKRRARKEVVNESRRKEEVMNESQRREKCVDKSRRREEGVDESRRKSEKRSKGEKKKVRRGKRF